MTFNDFVDDSLSEMLRFAVVVCGAPACAEDLVQQALLRTLEDVGDTDDPDLWAMAVRVWTVRGYLSAGMQLGNPAAPDLDTPSTPLTAQRAATGADAELGDRFAVSSKLQRCVLVLRYREQLDEAGIAELMGSTPGGIDTYLRAALRRLDVAPDTVRPFGYAARWTEDDLRRLLRDLDPDVPTGARLVAPVRPWEPLRAPAAIAVLPRPAASNPAPAIPTPAADGVEADDVFAVQVKRTPGYPSLRVIRPLIVLTTLLGLNYLVWRWLFSVHWAVWWIAVPLVIAETYSLIDSLLFGFTMWRLERRPEPGPPPPGATVDVFITTYDEPVELVMATARAAQRITYPHTLWILDDGNRAELRERAGALGIGVISRSSDWIDMPRHAKAGNLNNALMVTHGEFIVILDADQVPMPELLDRTLGYFTDERMAVVQTPQFFVNVPAADPLGSQAPLFYGPIQQGKDGWNSAFFCGSNAVLRREALLQMGVRRYVHELERRIATALDTARKVLRKARAALPADARGDAVGEALKAVLDATHDVRTELAAGAGIADATARFQAKVRAAARHVVEADIAMSRADLAELAEFAELSAVDLDELLDGVDTDEVEDGDAGEGVDVDGDVLDRLTRRDWSPLGAIETVRALIAAVDVDREDEAQPIMPMSTISVTEDMATCMRIHAMGWKSAYHDETLAVGLAPEDLGTMLTQRLRWAQGTVQVMLRENPLRQRGLSVPQKIMYLATMWTYLSGFTALVYIAAPVIYLVFGVLPVNALSTSFFVRLIPFLVLNQLLFFVIGRGRATWRGQQYSLALFPVWIKAVTSAVGNVVFGRKLTFAVTPKTRVHTPRRPWRLVRAQLWVMALLVVAATIGVLRYTAGQATGLGTSINVIWVCFDLALFSAIPRAVLYRGFEPDAGHPGAPDPTDPTPAAADLQEATT